MPTSQASRYLWPSQHQPEAMQTELLDAVLGSVSQHWLFSCKIENVYAFCSAFGYGISPGAERPRCHSLARTTEKGHPSHTTFPTSLGNQSHDGQTWEVNTGGDRGRLCSSPPREALEQQPAARLPAWAWSCLWTSQAIPNLKCQLSRSLWGQRGQRSSTLCPVPLLPLSRML